MLGHGSGLVHLIMGDDEPSSPPIIVSRMSKQLVAVPEENEEIEEFDPNEYVGKEGRLTRMPRFIRCLVHFSLQARSSPFGKISNKYSLSSEGIVNDGYGINSRGYVASHGNGYLLVQLVGESRPYTCLRLKVTALDGSTLKVIRKALATILKKRQNPKRSAVELRMYSQRKPPKIPVKAKAVIRTTFWQSLIENS